jgi:hypothetical protein
MQTDEKIQIINAVGSPETIITIVPEEPKPEPETKPQEDLAKKQMQSEVKVKNRFSSNEAELSNIPENQGSCFDYIPEMAQKYNVSADLMTRIIQAESGGRPLAKNTDSTASGCSQFIRGTWAGTLKQMGREWDTPFNAKLNVEAMAFKISRGGIGAWDASKSKWSK